MKRIIFILLIIPNFYSYCQIINSKLIIKTDSKENYVFINGELKEKGSEEISLPPGKYSILIKKSLLEWNGSQIKDTVNITGEGNRIEKHYSFGKMTLLDTRPQNAGVLARDSLIGYTPLFIHEGIGSVTILKDNYSPLHINPADYRNNIINLGTPLNGHTESFVKTGWFKVLIGTAAVLGAAAAYYKIKADRKYDDYLNNGSQALLDEVNRYDLISGIALGALQINFGALLYFLLIE